MKEWGEGSSAFWGAVPINTAFHGQADDSLDSHLLVHPAVPLGGLYPTDILMCVHKNVCLAIFTPAWSLIAQAWKQSRVHL